jgi:hypothetical protein
MINKKSNGFKAALMLVTVLGLSVSGSVFGADLYRVSARVFHLGELIGRPVLDVEVGKTVSGSYSVPGEAQYKFVVLVKPAADGELFISMQFTSGKIDIQPNLLVKIDEEASATIDKVRLTLLVRELVDSVEGTIVALSD